MINVGGKHIQLEDIAGICFEGVKIDLDETAIQKVAESFEFLKKFSRNKVIYGINTGFGPMAQNKIPADQQINLQFNLIRSHASGAGAPLSALDCRAVLLCRLGSLIQGHSGIHPNIMERIADWLNNEISPLVFEHGGVGASGDLVQLAHVALNLIGEGEVFYKGERKPATEVLKTLGIPPAQIYLREGLALINGTSVMTGIGLINLIYARRVMRWVLAASILCNEIVESFDDHYSLELNRVKRHPGQLVIASIMTQLLKDSKLTCKRDDHFYDETFNEEVITKKVQEYYSLRCISQILGPVYDTLDYSESVLIDEINSANDNPIIDTVAQNVYHGGNFHGDYVSLEMDKMKIAVTKMSILAERQLNFLCNARINNILPPFVNLGRLGLNFGVQGMQFTAVSTVAENQTLSNPMYVHSIPNNNDNQDIVSMGTNAALMTRKVINNTYEVVSIEMITLLQAIDYLKAREKLSSFGRGVYDSLREIFPRFEGDTPKYQGILEVAQYLKGNDPGMQEEEKIAAKKIETHKA